MEYNMDLVLEALPDFFRGAQMEPHMHKVRERLVEASNIYKKKKLIKEK
tara:strand:- start:279 stop:425 length:147 start_codon:yes stop_codon:yes gene_type:complete